IGRLALDASVARALDELLPGPVLLDDMRIAADRADDFVAVVLEAHEHTGLLLIGHVLRVIPGVHPVLLFALRHQATSFEVATFVLAARAEPRLPRERCATRWSFALAAARDASTRSSTTSWVKRFRRTPRSPPRGSLSSGRSSGSS